MAYIILDAKQAAQVRGNTGKGAALDPIELTNGSFALGDEVLNDPAHVRWQGLLKGLPSAKSIDPLWVQDGSKNDPQIAVEWAAQKAADEAKGVKGG